MLLAVRISSYGCTWKLWRAFKKLGLPSAAPRATLTHLSCCPNFLRASITRYTHAKHEQILKTHVTKKIKGMITVPGRNHRYSASVNRNGPGNKKFWRWKCQSNWTDPNQRGSPPEWEKTFAQPLLRNVPDMIWVQTLTLDLVQTYQCHIVYCIIK